MTIEHGTNAGYSAGCRLKCCRVAHRAEMTRWRKAKYVYRTVPARPVKRQLLALRKKGWSCPHVAAELGVCHSSTLQQIAQGRIATTHPLIAGAVAGLWGDVCAPVVSDRRRWPVEPFRAAVVARYGSVRALGNTNRARNIWRGVDLSTQTAERYADSLGQHPTELWPDWYRE